MRRSDLRRWAAALLVLFVLRAAPARADAAAAEVLIQQGLKLRRQGKPEEALDKFRQAHEMAPSPRTYGQIGLVEATLKRWTDSETHLSVALANPDDPWVKKNRAFLDQALALCREHVGDLVITGPAGAEVLVGGAPAGTLPAVPALRVAEGTVDVTATAPGYEPFKQSVSIRAGNRTTLKVTMTPSPVATAEAAPKVPVPTAPPPQPDVTPTTPEPDHTAAAESHWRGWTALGLGIAGAGALAAGITWLAINDTCPSGPRYQMMDLSFYCKSGASVTTPYQTKTRGEIMTALGAGALVAGAIVFFTGPSKSASVALAASPGALWLTGRF